MLRCTLCVQLKRSCSVSNGDRRLMGVQLGTTTQESTPTFYTVSSLRVTKTRFRYLWEPNGNREAEVLSLGDVMLLDHCSGMWMEDYYSDSFGWGGGVPDSLIARACGLPLLLGLPGR